jgi:hypothetical protein
MLTTDHSRPGLRRPVSATLLIAALLLLPSQVLAMDAASTDLEGAPDGSVNTLDGSSLTQLQDQLNVLSELNVTLETDNSDLSLAVEEMTRQRDRLQDSLGHFDDLYDPIEADRQLLVELRKGLPETRGEAEAQLDRIQRLALSSNPARLGQLVNRVSEAAPAYLDWRFTQFGSTQEASQSYINSGANAFDSNMEDLRSAVLLSVANRLDGLLTVIDRIR